MGDMTDEENEAMTAAEITSLSACLEDEKIVCMAVMGNHVHDVYSNERIALVVNRNRVFDGRSLRPDTGERRPGGRRCDPLAGVVGGSKLDGVDVVEVFSPERGGEMCAKFGLEQGMAMDMKSGYDFDLAADRARC